jgi:hypothetical protein
MLAILQNQGIAKFGKKQHFLNIYRRVSNPRTSVIYGKKQRVGTPRCRDKRNMSKIQHYGKVFAVRQKKMRMMSHYLAASSTLVFCRMTPLNAL